MQGASGPNTFLVAVRNLAFIKLADYTPVHDFIVSQVGHQTLWVWDVQPWGWLPISVMRPLYIGPRPPVVLVRLSLDDYLPHFARALDLLERYDGRRGDLVYHAEGVARAREVRVAEDGDPTMSVRVVPSLLDDESLDPSYRARATHPDRAIKTEPPGDSHAAMGVANASEIDPYDMGDLPDSHPAPSYSHNTHDIEDLYTTPEPLPSSSDDPPGGQRPRTPVSSSIRSTPIEGQYTAASMHAHHPAQSTVLASASLDARTPTQPHPPAGAVPGIAIGLPTGAAPVAVEPVTPLAQNDVDGPGEDDPVARVQSYALEEVLSQLPSPPGDPSRTRDATPHNLTALEPQEIPVSPPNAFEARHAPAQLTSLSAPTQKRRSNGSTPMEQTRKVRPRRAKDKTNMRLQELNASQKKRRR